MWFSVRLVAGRRGVHNARMRIAILWIVPLLLILVGAPAPLAAEPTLKALIARYQKEKGEPYTVRIKVLEEISALGTEPAVRFLVTVIKKDDVFTMRTNAIRQLARIPRPSAFAALEKLWRSSEDNLKVNILPAMVEHRKEPAVREIVKDVLAGDDLGLRSALIRYFGKKGDERFLPEAKRFIAEFPKSANRLTAALIGVKSPATARILIRIYDAARSYDRDYVPKVFAGGTEEVKRVLVDALQGGDERLVTNAIDLATRAKVGLAEPALVALLAGAKGQRKAKLIAAVGAVGARTKEGRAVLLAALGDKDPDLVILAVRGLRAAPGKEEIPLLIRLLKGADAELQAEIRVSLEQITGQQYGARADLWAKWWKKYGAAFDPKTVRATEPGAVDMPLVNLAIDKGAAALKSVRGKNPPWKYSTSPVGTTALVCLALHAAGVDRKDPDLRAGVEYLRKATLPKHTYSVALVAMALEAIGGKRYRGRVRECAKQLIETQLDSGLWNYPGLNQGDNSNAQYALLGLRAAARAGVRVPERTWRRACDHFLKTTCPDGGWSYFPTHRQASSSSMTAGGVSSLLICLENMKLDATQRKELVAAIDRGFDALGKKMKIGKDSLYALYGIERAGILGSRLKMAGKEWYAPGVERLIARQTRAGFWQGAYSDEVNTAFAILFLKKATVPLVAPVTTK